MTQPLITKKDVHVILNHAQRSLDYYKVLTPRIRQEQQVFDQAYAMLESAPALVTVLFDLLKVAELNMDGMEISAKETCLRAYTLLEQVKGETP